MMDIPLWRTFLGIAILVCFSLIYDWYAVDWLETHKPYIPAQTAFEVMFGVLTVLLIFLLTVGDLRISGVDSFFLLLVYFASTAPAMAGGSKRRTQKECLGTKR